MRSEIGTFPRILMEVFVFFFLLFYSSYVNGEGNTCTRQATGKCTNAIITIDKKSAKEETSFNVYIYRQEKKELAVMLIYENGYICRKTNGYTCTSLADDTFNVNIGCETLQYVVTLEGDGQQPITCRPEENPPAESTHSSTASNCDCRHKRESGNSVYHSRQKRCPCPNASPENPDENPNIRKEDNSGGKVDNLKKNGSLVIIIGMSLLGTSAAVVVVVVLYRKRHSCVSLSLPWRKKNRNEHIDTENANTLAPLNKDII